MLICLSANHKNSSFDVLEKLSVGAPGTAGGIIERYPSLSGAVIVATCNRFEAYLDLDEPDGASPSRPYRPRSRASAPAPASPLRSSARPSTSCTATASPSTCSR
ncbi:hypothetical protein [Cryobacterium sp. 10C3]|uniref:hypothetical protein n=1 Tax=Cryobacterium sp. 10C3 TaxID=3048577 RepID=UPI002AB3F9FC|nr:hypothetical protein [Cryobacterium sp. 10C3]MDY7558301.1 hypothetical protein [Cryobacterium sp. 10C3]